MHTFGWLNLSYVYVYVYVSVYVCVCVQILSKTFLSGPNLLWLNFLSFDFISRFFLCSNTFSSELYPSDFFLRTLLTVLHTILGIKIQDFNSRDICLGTLGYPF